MSLADIVGRARHARGARRVARLTASLSALSVLGVALVVAPADAREDKAQGKPGIAVASPSTTHKATGVVKRINKSRMNVTLDQDPIESLKWRAMSVTLPVRDAKLLDGLTVGQRVEFEFRKEHEGYVLTAIE